LNEIYIQEMANAAKHLNGSGLDSSNQMIVRLDNDTAFYQ
jgi:non-ribosomal peptide synthetase component E (peptide arylation enzyme)